MSLPHLTIYTDNLPPNVGGTAQAFVVKIRHKYKDNVGIHNHEYTHVKQWYKAMAAWVAIIALLTIATYDDLGFALAPLSIAGIGLHGLLYLFVRSYRLEMEAQAYAAQVKPDRSDLDVMARHMVSKDYYKFGITQERAKEEIQRWL